MDNTFSRVQKIITKVTGKKTDEITLETYIFKNLNIQSIDIVDLNFELEKEFNISLDIVKEFQYSKTIGKPFDVSIQQIIDIINKKN